MLCMALQPAWAGGPAAGPAQATTPGPQPVLHATLAAPAKAAARGTAGHGPVVVVALQDDEAPPASDTEPERQTTRGMLLAALALMAGIVLRRWDAGER
ncbi:hypothetical protein PE066_17740 [Ramlibacter tataouinensis]|uniref:hypothetical protein n=1 Tax=Ramlibacter tataouinensis TaxID=94132 RepID=UPI0022F4037F|nr:hypothetical protein [Ramlibacter tataouinensis]WBY01284.1 hypothetical protein PE066_17740 [Ramlibacter tataouinensis]